MKVRLNGPTGSRLQNINEKYQVTLQTLSNQRRTLRSFIFGCFCAPDSQSSCALFQTVPFRPLLSATSLTFSYNRLWISLFHTSKAKSINPIWHKITVPYFHKKAERKQYIRSNQALRKYIYLSCNTWCFSFSGFIECALMEMTTWKERNTHYQDFNSAFYNKTSNTVTQVTYIQFSLYNNGSGM